MERLVGLFGLTMGAALMATVASWMVWLLVVFAPALFFLGAVTMVPLMFFVLRYYPSGAELGHHKTRVLLVDDNPESLTIIEALLSKAVNSGDLDLEIVANGKEAAIRMTHDHYDWVFLDYFMPDMNGPEVLAAADRWSVREAGRTRGQANRNVTSVIGYTGFEDQTWELPKLHGFKFVGTLNKAMSPSKLATALQREGVLSASA